MSEELKSIMEKLQDLENRLIKIEGKPSIKTETDIKKLSIKELLLDKKPMDDVQKTLVIGYYLEHFEGMSQFNVKDLAEGFRAAKEPAPLNINDKVNSNVKKGLMMEDEEKDSRKAWVLTNTGEKFIEGLPIENK
jgi:hypothetical protein